MSCKIFKLDVRSIRPGRCGQFPVRILCIPSEAAVVTVTVAVRVWPPGRAASRTPGCGTPLNGRVQGSSHCGARRGGRLSEACRGPIIQPPQASFAVCRNRGTSHMRRCSLETPSAGACRRLRYRTGPPGALRAAGGSGVPISILRHRPVEAGQWCRRVGQCASGRAQCARALRCRPCVAYSVVSPGRSTEQALDPGTDFFTPYLFS